MTNEQEFFEKNKAAWNSRTDHHIGSAFYDMNGFRNGKNSLKDIELGLLGNVSGKTILHLQCHFGQDTLSLARMGAITTGVDLSDNAIGHAIDLAREMKLPARFICCNVYDLPAFLDEKFDILFTSYGTIGWLPDLDRWASLISRYLKPGGRFIFAEFHPVLWMFDNEFEKIVYPYAKGDPIVEMEQGTYAELTAPISTEMVTWNHSIAEVLSGLIKYGLHITAFGEYDYSPYDCFKHTVQFEPGKFRIRHLGNKVPMVYALSAEKK
jgi:ubiquinone/menaquinone biosynthesis C-methylase UbiE